LNLFLKLSRNIAKVKNTYKYSALLFVLSWLCDSETNRRFLLDVRGAVDVHESTREYVKIIHNLIQSVPVIPRPIKD
jgi:hypothetical protein